MEVERPLMSGHCKRVARWARELGILSALSDAELDELEAAALLHDVGFLSNSLVGVRQQLAMDKNMDEKTKRHPLLGFSILSTISGFNRIAEGVLHHHERFDGTGFPQRKRGEAIPLFARIIAVADMFDLESNPGTANVPDPEMVRKVILRERNRALDPDLANRFLFVITTSDELHRHDKKTLELPFSALKAGMVLARDLKSIDGAVLLKAGVALNDAVLNKAFSSDNLEWLLTTAYVDAASVKEGA